MNVLCIAGNITKDPDVRKTTTDKTTCSFGVAVNEGKDCTEFFNCVAWEKTADLISQYCKKGDRISLTGRVQTRKWQDKEGKDRYTTEVVVNAFDFPPKGKDIESVDDAYNQDVPF